MKKTSIEKKEIEEQIELLQKEAQDLMQERNDLQQRAKDIELRMVQIQGALSVLIPLIKKEGASAEKMESKGKTSRKKRATKKS